MQRSLFSICAHSATANGTGNSNRRVAAHSNIKCNRAVRAAFVSCTLGVAGLLAGCAAQPAAIGAHGASPHLNLSAIAALNPCHTLGACPTDLTSAITQMASSQGQVASSEGTPVDRGGRAEPADRGGPTGEPSAGAADAADAGGNADAADASDTASNGPGKGGHDGKGGHGGETGAGGSDGSNGPGGQGAGTGNT